MEQLKKERSPLRSAFTRIANLLENALKDDDKNLEEIDVLFSQLNEKWLALCPKEKEILEILSKDDKCSQDNYDSEYENFSSYEERFIKLRTKIGKISKNFETENKNENKMENCSQLNENTTKRKFKLPKIEFKMFGGDIKEWLPFWAQFEKIHLDEEIPNEDKYQYLLQATIKGSRAREIVESYPATKESYLNVIECLKNRFGRNDMLIEVYIREVLALMMNNSMSKSPKMPLFKLYDKIETYLRSLKMLGVSSENYSSILYPLIESCLPIDILKIWERNLSSNLNYAKQDNDKELEAGNKLDCLMNFLRHEIESEEKVKLARSGFNFENLNKSNYSSPVRRERNIPTAAELYNSSETRREICIFCSKSHLSSDCKYADNLSYDDKKQILMKKGACFKCLTARKHLSRFCKAKIPACDCGKFHFKVMCPGKSEQAHEIKSRQSENLNAENKKDSVLANKTSTRQVLLQTLIVRLRNKNKMKYIRILFDSGSSKSYLSTFVLKEMGYECIGEENLTHSLFGGVETVVPHKKYVIALSDFSDNYRCRLEVLNQDKICSEIPKIPRGSFINEIKKQRIYLSDLNDHVDLLYEFSPNEIHGLIGADVAGKLYTGNIKQLQSGLVLMETLLGWTLMGKTDTIENSDSTKSVMSLHVADAKITDLWQLDTLGILDPGEKNSRRELELAAEEHFNRSIKRDPEGRYEVKLPWIQGHPPLPTCRNVSERRLKGCVNSLKKTGTLEAYETVLTEWVHENVIEEVKCYDESEHYLPHRAVIKENSTTRVRPVFDGSAREKNSPSINDCLEKGPNIVELIPAVLNKFRLKKIGVIADIRRAFLQIGLSERDRPFLKFLWWEEGDPAKLKVFQHRRVVFGLTCSPYLLGATLRYHLKNVPANFEETASKLLDSFYIDNCITSVENYEELLKFVEESKLILSDAKFELRGWEHSFPYPSEEKIVPVLGLTWKLKNDTLSIDLRDTFEEDTPMTKRKILSAVHRIFDPIGFTCPVTLEPKNLLQECWKLKISWDAELPDKISKTFKRWRKEVLKLKEIEIPRCLTLNYEEQKNLSLHIFCDASKNAYATCIFLRCEFEDSVSCQLVQARSRVAPMKTTSIPRLELLACCIGARLANTVTNDLRLVNIQKFFWSDSANALYWIKGSENWAPFVFNRVSEIRYLSDPEDWHHIPGSLNAADLPSRGCSAETLVKSKWWEGVQWLRKPRHEWPRSNAIPDIDVVNSEKRKTVISATNHEDSSEKLYNRISSYNRLLRITAWVYRFFNNSKIEPSRRISGIIKSEEIMKAETVILKIVQKESFSGPEDKRLKALNCFIDSDGIMKVKTRILMREDTRNFRYPTVLPYDHPVVEKLIRTRHLNLNHAGVQILMSNLREDFWILKYRKTVRKVIKNCVRCKRFDDRPKPIPEAPLPVNRVKEAAVFEITGIDYAGPLILHGGQKVWIVIFTCAVYRAVHLEIATSMSTENFLQAFRRFIARRGRPIVVYTDNGSNFVGAENLLQKIDWNTVSHYSEAQKIIWKFNPPSAPWWGGWWERLIGIIKSILRKVLGRSSLNFEEMNTVICDTECIVNQRPLTYLSEDINDLTALTPAMFLQDIKGSGIPDLDILDSSSLNKRYAYRQRIKEDLRKRFRVEYLGLLRNSSKFCKENTSIQIGDIVLVSDNIKKIEWPLAKVVELYPSKDHNIRLVKVKMKDGEFLRPVLKLIPLEITHNSCPALPYSSQIFKPNSQPHDSEPVPVSAPPDSVSVNAPLDSIPVTDPLESVPVTEPPKSVLVTAPPDSIPATMPIDFVPGTEHSKTVKKGTVKNIPEKNISREKRSKYGRLIKPKVKFEFL